MFECPLWQQVGSQRLVRSVPGELNSDKNEALRLAQGSGHISKQQLTEVILPSYYCDKYDGMHCSGAAWSCQCHQQQVRTCMLLGRLTSCPCACTLSCPPSLLTGHTNCSTTVLDVCAMGWLSAFKGPLPAKHEVIDLEPPRGLLPAAGDQVAGCARGGDAVEPAERRGWPDA